MAAGTVRGTVVNTYGPKPWLAKFADGSTAGVGQYSGLREAQLMIELSIPGKILRWVRDDLGGVIEHYTGIDSF